MTMNMCGRMLCLRHKILFPEKILMHENYTCMWFGVLLDITLPCLNLLATFSQPRTSNVSQPSKLQPNRNTELDFILRRTQAGPGRAVQLKQE